MFRSIAACLLEPRLVGPAWVSDLNRLRKPTAVIAQSQSRRSSRWKGDVRTRFLRELGYCCASLGTAVPIALTAPPPELGLLSSVLCFERWLDSSNAIALCVPRQIGPDRRVRPDISRPSGLRARRTDSRRSGAAFRDRAVPQTAGGRGAGQSELRLSRRTGKSQPADWP